MGQSYASELSGGGRVALIAIDQVVKQADEIADKPDRVRAVHLGPLRVIGMQQNDDDLTSRIGTGQ